MIVTGKLDESGVFVAEKDSLITKCPSKFAEEAEDDPNIDIEEVDERARRRRRSSPPCWSRSMPPSPR